MQHHESREFIGCILGRTEAWNLQQVKHGMTKLVGHDIKELSNHRIDGCHSRRTYVLRCALPDLIQILIADGDRRPLIPGIRSATLDGLHGEVGRQAKWTEELLDFLKSLASPYVRVDMVQTRILWWHVFELDPVGPRLLAC